jgi:hypothetical protein
VIPFAHCEGFHDRHQDVALQRLFKQRRTDGEQVC